MVAEIYSQAKADMDKAIGNLKAELGKVRTGRASSAMLDSVHVDYYGTRTPLKNVASISTPDATLIVVTPWESNLVSEIEKAIREGGLGLNPMNDGKMVRVPIPSLSEERRKEMVKIVKKLGEESKVALRAVRRDANEMIKDLLNEKDISEDDSKKGQEQIQKYTDDYSATIDTLVAGKEKELMQF